MSLIIAAHAGTGKTTFTKMHPHEAIDLVCMPYKYILPEEHDKSESESCKANFDNEFNFDYPENYFNAIKLRIFSQFSSMAGIILLINLRAMLTAKKSYCNRINIYRTF
ncbi:MAG: hypothetical protein FWD48_11975 [Oscillospiraceae bacterium]|nr:hypothetical protein [Oscillospiraceae bacterium]